MVAAPLNSRWCHPFRLAVAVLCFGAWLPLASAREPADLPIDPSPPEDMSRDAARASDNHGAFLPRRKPPPPPLTPEALLLRHRLEPDHFGYVLFDPESGAWLDTHRDAALFIPASVAKVPTTIAALEALGPEYRFETRFMSAAPLTGGVLRGDLYLVGGGDSTLDEDRLTYLIDRLVAAGVRRVDGRFFYDDTALARGGEIEPSQPEHLGYNPGFSALCLNFNRVELVWNDKTGPIIRSALKKEYPEGPTVRKASPEDQEASRSGSFPRFEGGFSRPESIAAGEVPPPEAWVLPSRWSGSGSLWLPVKNSGAYTAAVGRAIARQKSLELPVPRFAPVPGDARVLAAAPGGPVRQVVRGVLSSSNNLTAEILGLAAARELTGESDDLASSAFVIQSLFTSVLDETDWAGFFLANHSGMSLESRISPRQIVAILAYGIDGDRLNGVDYAALLPQQTWPVPGGKAGAVAPVKVWAKTGTVYYGRGLAGVVETASGRRLLFGIFSSDFERRRVFDETNGHGSGAQMTQARDWLARARALERDLLSDWIRRY